MSKVTGVKSVDFKIKGYGYGVVNWNGATVLVGEDGKENAVHSLPKLRGYTNLTGKENENGYKYKKSPREIDFRENPLYISQNCIRHHLFKDQTYDLHFAKDHDKVALLASITGLIRGYVIPAKRSCKRTSPLLITDFIDILGHGNFEQMGRSGPKEGKKSKEDNSDKASNSFFSKTTFGDTEYYAFGSISIEQLQFISLDHKFDRAALDINNNNQAEEIAQKIQDFIQSLDPSRQPKAIFHQNYVRKGTIFEEGEAGILLDDTAVDILIQTTLNMLRELTIKQAKGYMYVDSIAVDYNDSNKMMRIKQHPDQVNPKPESAYAVYFYAK